MMYDRYVQYAKVKQMARRRDWLDVGLIALLLTAMPLTTVWAVLIVAALVTIVFVLIVAWIESSTTGYLDNR